LFGLYGRIFSYPVFTGFYELIDAIGFDVSFAMETQLFLYLHLYPEALAVETVLVSLIMTQHGVVTLEDILVGSAPGMMDAHGIISGDGAVKKGPPGFSFVLIPELLEALAVFPEPEDPVFHLDEGGFGVHLVKHDCFYS
jgi:hypothetical protein